MKFYDRISGIATLQEIERASTEMAQMTIMVGRRPISKTTLLKKTFETAPFLYFFAAKKNEMLLCDEFSQETGEKLGIPIGSFTIFAELFRSVMQLSQRMNFTLVIDEFQEFHSINPSVFSDMQNIWDSAKDTGKINLILCGSSTRGFRWKICN